MGASGIDQGEDMRAILTTSAAALAVALAATPAAAQQRGEKIQNSYICVFKAREVNRGQVQAEANRAAQAVGARVTHVYSVAIRGFAPEPRPRPSRTCGRTIRTSNIASRIRS